MCSLVQICPNLIPQTKYMLRIYMQIEAYQNKENRFIVISCKTFERKNFTGVAGNKIKFYDSVFHYKLVLIDIEIVIRVFQLRFLYIQYPPCSPEVSVGPRFKNREIIGPHIRTRAHIHIYEETTKNPKFIESNVNF